MAGLTLITTATRLYCKSFKATIGFTALLALSLHILYSPGYLPKGSPLYQYSVALWLAALTLLFAIVVILMDNLAKAKNLSKSEMSYILIERFASFIGSLLSSLLLPAILLVLGIVVSILLHRPIIPPLVITVWNIVVGLGIFASFVPKFFAPFLVLTQKLDVDSALEKSEQSVKGHFGKTYCYSLLGIVFWGVLATFPSWLSQILIMLTGSWPIALWLTQLYEFEFGHT